MIRARVTSTSQEADALKGRITALLANLPEEQQARIAVEINQPAASIPEELCYVELATALNQEPLGELAQIANLFLENGFAVRATSGHGATVELHPGLEQRFTIKRWIPPVAKSTGQRLMTHFYCPHCGAYTPSRRNLWNPRKCKVCSDADKKLVAGEPRYCFRCGDPFIPDTGSGVGNQITIVCPDCKG